jgi:transcriptional regulator with XRE-family HTH domain
MDTSPDVDARDVGDRLAVLMEELDIPSITKLAEFLGVKRSKVSNWRHGYNFPPVESVWVLTRKAEVTLDWLYGGDTQLLPNTKRVRLEKFFNEIRANREQKSACQ